MHHVCMDKSCSKSGASQVWCRCEAHVTQTQAGHYLTSLPKPSHLPTETSKATDLVCGHVKCAFKTTTTHQIHGHWTHIDKHDMHCSQAATYKDMRTHTHQTTHTHHSRVNAMRAAHCKYCKLDYQCNQLRILVNVMAR